jgi:hypothetical protein
LANIALFAFAVANAPCVLFPFHLPRFGLGAEICQKLASVKRAIFERYCTALGDYAWLSENTKQSAALLTTICGVRHGSASVKVCRTSRQAGARHLSRQI